MQFQGVHLRGDSDTLEISMNGGRDWAQFQAVGMRHCMVGISIQNGPVPANDPIYEIE
jgi:hypothetical protein